MEPSRNNHSPPRNYFSRREQLRLLMLVAGLGLVVLCMIEAGKPQNWHWLTGEGRPPAAEPVTSYDEDYDTSYQPTPVAEPPDDTFRITPNFDPMEDVSGRYFPGVIPRYLDEVEDNSPFIEEDWAWYNLLGVLANNDSKLINDASTGRVSFVQLFEQPEIYRGQLVTVRGAVRRVEWFDYKENPANIAGVHRLILLPKDGPPRPLVLYTLELPKDFPTNDDIHQDIVATGFFYKNWHYVTDARSWLAPVVLARDFTWHRHSVRQTFQPTVPMMVGIGLAVGVLAVAIACGVYRRSRHLFSNALYGTSREASDAAIARLNDIEQAPTVAEQLKDLASEQ